MAVYSITADVRELARSVLASEFPDNEILEEQTMAQSKIWTVTQKNDWNSTDYQFEYIKKLETKQAAIYVLEHYNVIDIQPIIEMWQKQIDEGLKEITDTISTSPISEPDLEIASKDYETYPKNLNARISRGRLTKVGFNPATDMDTTVYSSKYDL